MKHRVYGPVPSRRFGRSLGIDLVPLKVCSYECLYCQLGRTTNLTTTREDYYPLDEILRDLDDRLDQLGRRGIEFDIVTLAGSGEPTLYKSLVPLITGIKERTDRPVLMLTNGSMLWDPEVLEAALMCDILEPSLDFGTPETFRRINVPAEGLTFEKVVGGIREACSRHTGQVRIEVMLTGGVNDSEEELRAMKALLDTIPHQVVDINTPVRPAWAADTASPETLAMAKEIFGEKAVIVSAYRGTPSAEHEPDSWEEVDEEVANLIAIHPSTLDEISAALDLADSEVLESLSRIKARQVEVRGRRYFWLKLQ